MRKAMPPKRRAPAEAEARKLELARNRLELHHVARIPGRRGHERCKFEVGQVVAEGQPIVSIATEGEPEIVVNVPEDQLAAFKTARYKAIAREHARRGLRRRAARTLAAGGLSRRGPFARALSPPPRGRCRSARRATLTAARAVAETPAAAIPAAAITQNKGQPAVWVVRRAGSDAAGTVDLMNVTDARLSQRRGARIGTGRRASWSSPPASRRWRPACASRWATQRPRPRADSAPCGLPYHNP